LKNKKKKQKLFLKKKKMNKDKKTTTTTTTSESSSSKESGGAQPSSAYASAESSPNTSITPSTSLSSFPVSNLTSLTHEQLLSYDTSNHTKLMQELVHHVQTHPLDATTSRGLTTSPSTTSFDKLNKFDQFQSLPPNICDTSNEKAKASSEKTVEQVIKSSVDEMVSKIGPQKSPQPQKSSVMSFIEKMLKSSPNKNKDKVSDLAAAPQPAAPATTTTTSNTLAPTINTSSSSPNPESNTYKLLSNNDVTPTIAEQKSPNLSANRPTVSTLSPNGTTINDAVAIFNAASSIKVPLSSLSSTSSSSSSSSAAVVSQQQDELKKKNKTNDDEKIMDHLTSMDRKEHEKQVDPLSNMPISQAVAAQPVGADQKSTHQQQQQQPHVQHQQSSGCLNKEKSMDTTNVPSSSQQFAKDLNSDLAAAAAAAAAASATTKTTIVVVNTLANNKEETTSSSSTTPSLTLNERFTSNASTSSIHNDLKMILEEGKETKVQQQQQQHHQITGHVQPKAASKQQHKHGKSSPDSGRKQQYNIGELAKAMKLENMMNVNNNNNNNKNGNKIKESRERSSGKEDGELSSSSSISLGGETKYRYSKDFLNQIRDERAGFIETIYPDIFKAYCYCMNGNHWDPEKYFDIVQYPGEYEKIEQNNYKSNKTSNNYYKSNNNSNNNNNQQQQMRNNKYHVNNMKPHTNNKQSVNDMLLSMENNDNVDSPQLPQVPKNSPKSVQSNKGGVHSNKHKKSSHESAPHHHIGLTGFGLMAGKENMTTLSQIESNEMNVDKIILNMLKKKSEMSPPQPQPQSSTNTNSLLDMINNVDSSKKHNHKSHQKHQNSNNSSNKIIEDLLNVKMAQPQPLRHFPQVLTAAELEMTQLSQSQAKMMNKFNNSNASSSSSSGNNNNTSSSSSCSGNEFANHHHHHHHQPSSNPGMNHISDAYKQLVKNLSNHPLSTPPSSNTKHNEDILSTLHKKKMSQQQQAAAMASSAAETTKALKKFLNISSSKTNNGGEEKKSKKKNHSHSSHHRKSSKQNGESSSSSKFPSTNPHEKPFQSLLSEHLIHAPAMPPVEASSSSSSSHNPIESFINKMNDQQNFNSILSKIMPGLANQVAPVAAAGQVAAASQSQVERNTSKSDDILKWFNVSTSQHQHHSEEPKLRLNSQVNSLFEIESREFGRTRLY
jgi:hypothetical protein